MPTKPKSKKRYRYIAQVVVETDEPVTKKAVRNGLQWVIVEGMLHDKQTPIMQAIVRRNIDAE